MLRSRFLIRRVVGFILSALIVTLGPSAAAQPTALSLRELDWSLPRAPLGAHCAGNVVCTELGTWGVHARLTGATLIREDRSVPGGLLTPAASFTFGGWGEVGGQFPILLGPLGTPPLPLPAVLFAKGTFTPPHWIGTHGILFGSLTLPYGVFSAIDEKGHPKGSRYEIGAAVSGHLLWMLHYGMAISGQLSPSGPPPQLLTGLELLARFDGWNVFAQATHSAGFCFSSSLEAACQSLVMVLGGLRIPLVFGHSSAAAGAARGARNAEGTVVEVTLGLTYDESTRARYGDGIEKAEQLWVRLFNAVIDPYLDERCVLWDDDHQPMLDLGLRSKDGLHCERDGLRTPIHTHFDRDQRSTRVCYDKGLRNCVLRRNSAKDAWEVLPRSQQARRPYLKEDCHVYEAGVPLPLKPLGIKSSDGQACEWEGHRYPIGTEFWALPDDNVMCQDATLKRCSIELPEKPMSTGQYVAGRSIDRPVIRGAQKVLEAIEQGTQVAADLATGELEVGTWDEQLLGTLKGALGHLNLEDAKKLAKAAEQEALKKARELAEKPLHQQLGDAGETLGDATVTILGNKGLGALGNIGSGAGGIVRGAEERGAELTKAIKAEKRAEASAKAASVGHAPLGPQGERIDTPRTLFRRGADGRVNHYQTFEAPPSPRDPRPVVLQKRFDGVGESHAGVPTPHIHEPGKPGGPLDRTRHPPRPDELPKGF